jgi:hypothetical protein
MHAALNTHVTSQPKQQHTCARLSTHHTHTRTPLGTHKYTQRVQLSEAVSKQHPNLQASLLTAAAAAAQAATRQGGAAAAALTTCGAATRRGGVAQLSANERACKTERKLGAEATGKKAVKRPKPTRPCIQVPALVDTRTDAAYTHSHPSLACDKTHKPLGNTPSSPLAAARCSRHNTGHRHTTHTTRNVSSSLPCCCCRRRCCCSVCGGGAAGGAHARTLAAAAAAAACSLLSE